MTGTLMLLFGMLMMIVPQIMEVVPDKFGTAQALRRAFSLESEVPEDMTEALQILDEGGR